MADTPTSTKMPTNTKIMILVVVLIIAGLAIWYFTKDDKKEILSGTTTNTKTGLAGLNLSGFLGGLFGKTGSGNQTVDGSMGTKPTEDKPTDDEIMEALASTNMFG
jgi:hypothetical protein